MRILVCHAPPFRRWLKRLGERLSAAGHEVYFRSVGDAVGRPVLALERRVYGIRADWDAILEPPPLEPATPADLTIVLAGPTPKQGRVIAPQMDEGALIAALRRGSAPRLVILGGFPSNLQVLVAGTAAVEDPLVLARALEDVFPRLVTLLAQAVAALDGESTAPVCDGERSTTSTAAPPFILRGLRQKFFRRLGRARGRPDHWRLALRRAGMSAWMTLDGSADAFRADPFLFEHDERLWLFFEEYPYATGKGVIGCRHVSAAGRQGQIDIDQWEERVVLEEPFHMSYPLVLRHRDAIYMLPETSAAARVQLYRADRFPDRWIADTILVEGHRLADATPVFHDGRWWLFATSDDDGGSSWDQLFLFHAPDLLGPWTPHVGNPVLIDAGAARPAGRMWHEGGVLMRPAQDCRRGYGGGIAICRVDLLDLRSFRQTVVGRMDPPAGSGATGLHTFNAEAGWEVVDLKTAHPS